jgi:hypothetical protein
MMDLKKLETMSHELDEYIMDFSDKHDLAFLELAAVMLARLSHISYQVDERKNFARLMDTAIDTVLNSEPDDIKPSTSVH